MSRYKINDYGNWRLTSKTSGIFKRKSYFELFHYNENGGIDQFHEFLLTKGQPFAMVVRTAEEADQQVQFLDIDDGSHKIHIKHPNLMLTLIASRISNIAQK